MNLSTRLDYLGPANLCLRLRRTARPALRPLRNSPERRPPLWTGHFSVFAGLEFPTRNGRSKAKRPVRHRFAPIRLKSTFEALRREGSDFTDLQFALAGHVCATRTLNAVRVRRPGKSERLHPTGNAPPSHHSSVTLNLEVSILTDILGVRERGGRVQSHEMREHTYCRCTFRSSTCSRSRGPW